MGPGDDFQVLQTISGVDTNNITEELLNGIPWFNNNKTIMLVKAGDNCHEAYTAPYTPLTAAFYDSGIVLFACVYKYRSEHYINFRIQIPRSYSGRTQGFYGNFDGNSANEFFERGETSPLQDTFEQGNNELDNYMMSCECDYIYKFYHACV